MSSPVEIVRKLLNSMTDAEVVSALVAPDATYVSLNQANPDLKKIMPWCGTYDGAGPSAFSQTFTQVAHYWTNEGVQLQAVFGSEENVAAFGTMTLRSKTQDISRTTPFSVWCVVKGGRIVYMQFMEDTFATAATFRSGGVATFVSNPDSNHSVTI